MKAVKNVVILGSTGSIGINTLKVIDRFPDCFKVIGLTAYNNIQLLEKQIDKYAPSHVAVGSRGIDYLKNRINGRTRVWDVGSEISQLVTLPSVDIVIIGMSGSAALEPFLSALHYGKTVAPANKEAIVIGGDLIIREAKQHNAKIIPIDSEQSAIFQCIEGHPRSEVHKVYLTASGGALRDVPRTAFDRLSVKQILQHPRWKMGKKITVDSASLMNKGFEVIEAKWLFGLNVDDIEVVIHPEAIIHSMVGFKDGAILAQMGVTDMRLPIQYALSYPHRWESGLPQVDFFDLKQLTFRKPDFKKFPSLALAIYTARKGGTLPCVLNAADEEAVDAFLNKRISFSKIYRVVEKVVLNHKTKESPTLKDIKATDRWAREEAKRLIFN